MPLDLPSPFYKPMRMFARGGGGPETSQYASGEIARENTQDPIEAMTRAAMMQKLQAELDAAPPGRGIPDDRLTAGGGRGPRGGAPGAGGGGSLMGFARLTPRRDRPSSLV